MPETQLEPRTPKLETDLKDLAQDIVRRAIAGGATSAECVVREGDEFSTLVRLGQVETLKEAGSKAIGVRVFHGQRAASTYSSDFSREGLDRMLELGARAREDYLRRPLCRHPRSRATGLSPRRSRPLPSRCLLAPRRKAHRLCPPCREGCARLRSAHPKLRRRLLRRGHRTQSSGQFPWICRRVPPLLLFGGCGAHCPRGKRRHAAGLLVLGRPQPRSSRVAGAGRQNCGRANPSPSGRS